MPAKGGGAYGDRRLADVELVDYARPGFAVVWLDGAAQPAENARLAIRANEFETRLEPAWVAVGAGGTLDLVNTTREAHTVSCPSLGVVRKLEPGQSLALRVPNAGAHSLFLLDRPQVEGGVFAADGPFAVLTNTGRFELRDVAPGPARLHVWHPRFPPVERGVEVLADQTLRVDLEMGVGRGDQEASR
jgi:plastocyanin